MFFKDLLDHFKIDGDFPEYLLSQPFNDVFADGDLTREGNSCKITIKTRQNVTHRMFINPNDEFPVAVISELPSGLSNGMKFGQREGAVEFISEL